MYASVRNRCINYLKREKKKELSIYYNLETVISNDSDIQHPLSDDYPIDLLIARDLHIKIERAIEKLPPQCREIFILSRVKRLSNKEIAQQMNISEGSIKSQLFRALSKIRIALPDYFLLFLLYSPF